MYSTYVGKENKERWRKVGRKGGKGEVKRGHGNGYVYGDRW